MYRLCCATIDPEASSKVKWDVFVVLIVIYVAFVIPIQVAFNADTMAMNVVDVFVDLIFITDIWLNFRTGDLTRFLTLLHRR